jgi:hypothetical protein
MQTLTADWFAHIRLRIAVGSDKCYWSDKIMALYKTFVRRTKQYSDSPIFRDLRGSHSDADEASNLPGCFVKSF